MSDEVLSGLVDRLVARDPRAIARAISIVESESPSAATLLARIFPRTGRAYLIGLTGPPGAGKSTLADRLVTELRKGGATVGVLAVDPTSPYTGGALLGDRVRMQQHAGDAGVYIRSMATRGHLGGLARTTADASLVLDAAGFDVVIIETVGVGQDEIEIVRTADVSILVLVPGAGDDVQALKAGVMEIADIFVVNKADRDGADRSVAAIEGVLALAGQAEGAWTPPVLRTEATTGRGVAEVIDAIQRFRTGTPARLETRRRARADWRLHEILGRRFVEHVERRILPPGAIDRWLDRITRREIDPYSAADSILEQATAGVSSSGALGVEYTIDHVGVAVEDATALVTFFQQVFGLDTDEPEVVGLHRLRFVATGDATVELVEPLSTDSPIGRYLARHGPGIHHVCFRVGDIDAALSRLSAKGVRLIDTKARTGAHGSRIAFLHPSAANGLLIELKEKPADAPRRS
jgi:LAO/AO transport system kinase